MKIKIFKIRDYLKYFKFTILLPFEFVFFFVELVIYKFLKIKNSERSFQTFIKLFLLTGGLSNDLIHKLLLKKKKNSLAGMIKKKLIIIKIIFF